MMNIARCPLVHYCFHCDTGGDKTLTQLVEPTRARSPDVVHRGNIALVHEPMYYECEPSLMQVTLLNPLTADWLTMTRLYH